MNKKLIYLIGFVILYSCSNPPTKNANELEKIKGNVKPETVSITTVIKGDFKQQFISNGKIIANQLATLRFQTTALLKKLSIKNGQKVKKGDTLAILENGQNMINLTQAENTITKSKLDLLDELLLAGYKTLDDSSKLTKNGLTLFKIKSGFKQAKLNYKKAILDYNHTFLIAPFSGIIANLEKQTFDLINSNEEFCTLYNHSSLSVEFKLMEMEISNVYLGQKIMLSPFNNPNNELFAAISEINPVVDENGLLRLKATINSSNQNHLFTGLNMHIIIEHSIASQLIVPKEAVVLRSNRNVIFCFKDSLAKWVYVDLMNENEKSYAISGEVKEGDQVIVTNNLNLAHDAKVTIVKTKND